MEVENMTFVQCRLYSDTRKRCTAYYAEGRYNILFAHSEASIKRYYTTSRKIYSTKNYYHLYFNKINARFLFKKCLIVIDKITQIPISTYF